MREAKQVTKPSPYASSADLCRIFQEDTNRLYLLSFLLTADREKAEQSFVSGLHDAVEGNPVFKEWARSWARRAIIQNAIRLLNPRPDVRSSHPTSNPIGSIGVTVPAEQRVEIAAVLALNPFDRFVYVMSVLERYSDLDSSLLLGCERQDVIAARSRALQRIGAIMELHNQQEGNTPVASSVHERQRSLVQLLLARPLATLM